MAAAGPVKCGGRPEKSPDERLVHFNVRITEWQADELCRRAYRSGQSVGSFLRGLLRATLVSVPQQPREPSA